LLVVRLLEELVAAWRLSGIFLFEWV